MMRPDLEEALLDLMEMTAYNTIQVIKSLHGSRAGDIGPLSVLEDSYRTFRKIRDELGDNTVTKGMVLEANQQGQMVMPETEAGIKLANRCAKQVVGAFAIVDNVLYVGTNECLNPQKVCPREGMKTGEGYELCRDVCKQTGHAEVNLIKKVGGDLKGAPVVLMGHTYICDDCRGKLEDANCGSLMICPPQEGWGEA